LVVQEPVALRKCDAMKLEIRTSIFVTRRTLRFATLEDRFSAKLERAERLLLNRRDQTLPHECFDCSDVLEASIFVERVMPSMDVKTLIDAALEIRRLRIPSEGTGMRHATREHRRLTRHTVHFRDRAISDQRTRREIVWLNDARIFR